MREARGMPVFLCQGPMVSLTRSKQAPGMYKGVTAEDAKDMLAAMGGEPVARLAVEDGQPFFTKQRKVVREFAGTFDPEELEDCIRVGAYTALLKGLTQMTPTEVIHEVSASGLRGRGGAGFPTGLKWSTVAKASSTPKYVVCNGDEGDPGAFMDRSVMEGDPHRVIEGMILAGYAVGAKHGYIYVRAEYPLAVKRLNRRSTRRGGRGCWGGTFSGRAFPLH